MKVTLTVIEGKPEGLEIPLKGPRFSIGRDTRCNLRPNSDLVSKQHCLVATDTGRVLVSDLGSTNGTFVNDVKVEGKVEVTNGDRIKVGPLTFSVRVVVEKPVVAAVAPTKNGRASVLDDDPLQWLLADDEGKMAEPSGNTTVLDMRAAAMEDTLSEKKTIGEEPAPSEPGPRENKPANMGEGKLYRPAQQAAKNDKNTHDAATDILNRYLVRRRPG